MHLAEMDPEEWWEYEEEDEWITCPYCGYECDPEEGGYCPNCEGGF